jgi:hypothetical protein
MRAIGLVLVLLSLALAGGVTTRAVGGADADARIAKGERCEVPAEVATPGPVPPARTRIALTPPTSGVEVVPLNTRGYNYDPLAAPTPGRRAEPTPPASPER